MNRYMSIALVFVLLATLLAACAPAATPAPAQQPAATAGQAAAQPGAPAARPFRVGLVTDVGKIDDKGFLQSSWEGVQRAQKELGAEVKYIQTTDAKDFEKNIAQFADAGYDVIVVAGFGPTDATIAAAKKYPGIKFIGIAQTHGETLPNLVSLNHPEDQAGFLGGALAASMSKKGILGSVQATDAVPAVWRYGEGFRAGANYIKPGIQINVIYHNDVGFDKTFNDPEWGKTTAASMIDKGADVIFAGASDTGNGALLGAAQKGAMAIGMDVDAYQAVPEAAPAMLSSGVKLISDDTFNIIKAAKEGNWQSGNVMGQVALAPYHDYDGKVPADVKAKMEEILKGLRDGSIKTNVAPTKPGK
jgi:basic membrane protein A and related proteins